MAEPVASRVSPFTALEGSEWLVEARTGEEGISIQLTDLCVHYRGRCSREDAHKLLVDEYGSPKLDPMFRLLHECIDGKYDASLSVLKVISVESPPGEPPKRLALHWYLRGKAALIVEVEKSHSCCCLLYTSPSPRDRQKSRMPSSA